MRARRRRGQSLVEFTLIVPMFALMLFGLFDIGRTVYLDNAIAQAVREGARWGSVDNRAGSVAGRQAIVDKVRGSLVGLVSPSVTVSCRLANGADTSGCPAGSLLSVRLDTSITLMTPLLADLVGPVPLASKTEVDIQ